MEAGENDTHLLFILFSMFTHDSFVIHISFVFVSPCLIFLASHAYFQMETAGLDSVYHKLDEWRSEPVVIGRVSGFLA
jgi:hypothetical protein